jgi:hypothetical protein
MVLGHLSTNLLAVRNGQEAERDQRCGGEHC